MKTNVIYRRELQVLRPVFEWAKRHPHVVNVAGGAAMAFSIYHIFMYA